jgi:hypothetical protein
MVTEMLRELLFTLVTVVLLTPGCIELQNSESEEISETKPLPFELAFKSETLNRAEDEGIQFDLKDELENGPVMLLWIGAGCTGCHDWTDMIREKVDTGVFNDSNITIISVHRWAEFESKDELMNVFGTVNESTHYTPWKIVIPTEETQAYDLMSGENTGATVYSAYGDPGTPTLQIIAENGVLAWQSKTYWANETVFNDGFSFFQQQVVEA